MFSNLGCNFFIDQTYKRARGECQQWCRTTRRSFVLQAHNLSSKCFWSFITRGKTLFKFITSNVTLYFFPSFSPQQQLCINRAWCVYFISRDTPCANPLLGGLRLISIYYLSLTSVICQQRLNPQMASLFLSTQNQFKAIFWQSIRWFESKSFQGRLSPSSC